MSTSFNAFYYTSTSFKFAKLLSSATHELTPQHYTSWPGSHVMPCHVTRCQVAFRHDTLYMSQHVAACHSMSQQVTACHSMSQHVTACHSMSQRHVMSCHVLARQLSGHAISCHLASRHAAFTSLCCQNQGDLITTCMHAPRMRNACTMQQHPAQLIQLMQLSSRQLARDLRGNVTSAKALTLASTWCV